LKYRFSSRRRRSSCSCGPSSASVISPDLEHGERLILGARTGGDRSHEPATLRELMDRAPGGAFQGQNPARGAPDAVPQRRRLDLTTALFRQPRRWGALGRGD
jgi:hypothetical protein